MFKNKNKILYKDWIYDWISNKKYYIKESTYANYSSIIHNHLIPDLGYYKIVDLNNKIIQKFILKKYPSGSIYKNGGWSDKTINAIILLITQNFKFAFKLVKANIADTFI